jgi:hypothetical protein
VKGPTTDDVQVTQDDVKQILTQLFPDLTPAEIDELAASLDVEAALKLKAEIEGIRDVAGALSLELQRLAQNLVETRRQDLEPQNGGFPTTVEPVGRAAFYDSARAEGRIDLSGIFSNTTPVELAPGEVTVQVGGVAQTTTLGCLHDGVPTDIVFLVDITGSMSPVIGAVRRSLLTFVDAIVAHQITGTLSVVTFQDSVGVNVTFQQSAPASGFERSPFFTPVAINDATAIGDLERFITRLEANSGEDTPENLAGAIDFARNNVIGLTSTGTPNVIGDGAGDPSDVQPFPALTNSRQVFVVLTDAPFHSDSRDATNSSLLAEFKPRPIAEIMPTLRESGTTVHVSDPSWVDKTLAPTGSSTEVEIDSDLWATSTGGLGEDRVLGYSLVDLELLVVAQQTGLLDIVLDGVLSSTCSVTFPLPTLAAGATFDLRIDHASETFTESMTPIRY